jgi:nucleotide-binding universal stress UspA family protein
MQSPQPPFQSILVPIDGSDTSINAARLAIRLASTYRAELCFLYVVDTRSVAKMARFEVRTEEELQKDLRNQGQRYLSYAAKLASAAGQMARTALRVGVPQTEITAEARERRTDLIVIGRVGQRGPRRILIGSVAERVIEYAPCPVLVVQR